MDVGAAVATAMKNIMREKHCRPDMIASRCGISENSIKFVITRRVNAPSIKTIHEFCCGTGYTLEEFFAREEFDDLE